MTCARSPRGEGRMEPRLAEVGKSRVCARKGELEHAEEKYACVNWTKEELGW